MTILKIDKKLKDVTFDDLQKVGLTPNCLACIHSKPEGFFNLSCKYDETNEIIGIDDNLYEKKCDKFVTDEIGLIQLKETNNFIGEIHYRTGKYIKII